MKPTFTISKDKCSITCLKCGRTSHNLNEQFCQRGLTRSGGVVGFR